MCGLFFRCSGVNHCSFILTKDCPGADLWGTGNLTIKFVCVAGKQANNITYVIGGRRSISLHVEDLSFQKGEDVCHNHVGPECSEVGYTNAAVGLAQINHW